LRALAALPVVAPGMHESDKLTFCVPSHSRMPTVWPQLAKKVISKHQPQLGRKQLALSLMLAVVQL